MGSCGRHVLVIKIGVRLEQNTTHTQATRRQFWTNYLAEPSKALGLGCENRSLRLWSAFFLLPSWLSQTFCFNNFFMVG